MASVVIITKQCYLLCEAINYIAINEVEEDESEIKSIFDPPSRERKGRKKVKSKKPAKKQVQMDNNKQFQIVIDFIPTYGTNSNRLRQSGTNPDSTSVTITVTGRDRCLELFERMVDQIREQIPDNLFLDKMVQKFLTDCGDKETT